MVVNPRYIFAVPHHIYSHMVAKATALFRVKRLSFMVLFGFLDPLAMLFGKNTRNWSLLR